MSSRASAPALRLQTKLHELARRIWGRLTRTDEAGYRGDLVDTMTDTFVENHSATALIMVAMPAMAAAFFDLIDGAASENPLLFISGVLFCCAGALSFELRQQNPR
jgi:hypothetical protein